MVVRGYLQEGKEADILHVCLFGDEFENVPYVDTCPPDAPPIKGTISISGSHFQIKCPKGSDSCEVSLEDGKESVPVGVTESSKHVGVSGQFVFWLACWKYKLGFEGDPHPLTEEQQAITLRHFREAVNQFEGIGVVA